MHDNQSTIVERTHIKMSIKLCTKHCVFARIASIDSQLYDSKIVPSSSLHYIDQRIILSVFVHIRHPLCHLLCHFHEQILQAKLEADLTKAL